MHTNTMSPVSFGPLSQKNSCNPDRLGHGVDWVTLVSIQFLRLAGSVTCTGSRSPPPQSVCLSSTVRRPVLVITHRSLSSLTPSLNVMAEIVTLASANFLCRVSTVRALSLSLARHSYEYHLTLRSGLTPPAVLLKLLRVRPQHSELSRPDSEVEFPNDCARACLLCWWEGALAGPSLTDVHSWAVSTVKVGGYPSHAS